MGNTKPHLPGPATGRFDTTFSVERLRIGDFCRQFDQTPRILRFYGKYFAFVAEKEISFVE